LQVDVYFTAKEIIPEDLKEKIAVVIDVLRASTTLTTALQNGCSQIIPVAEVNTAKALAAQQSKSTTLLCGERHGRKLPGFHLGNSPAEYIPEVVRNKTLIFTSTNGARLLTQTKYASTSILASFVNADMVSDYIINAETDIVLLCAGDENTFSLEDSACAGLFVYKLFKTFQSQVKISDAALATMILFNKFGHNLLNMLLLSSHGRYLKSIGFGNDLPICANLNSVAVLPVFMGGVLKLLKTQKASAEIRE